ncbi:MAG TPA: GNAT family N-acetyltransferase [Anaerolineaceae bacterium]|nr:GNAT family N-acetyltransferase [Anaerolineaceae bacterium]
MLPEILTPRLKLRAFRPEDAADLHEYLSDARVYRFEPGEPISHEEAQQKAERMSVSPNYWAVELQNERKVIGQVWFCHLEPGHLMTWELGYILSPFYQRQGYTFEAAGALLRYGFSQWQIHRVTANCNPENTASWKLLEKLGFRREGLLKEEFFSHRDPDGNPIWTDTFVYALLAGDIR